MSGFITYRDFSLSETPRLDGKVAVVTGGQAGIGEEISAQLLIHGIAKLYILARSEDKYNGCLQEWQQRSDIKLFSSASDSGQREGSVVEFVQCDLGDMLAVKRAVDYIRGHTDRLDILICNASPPILPAYSLSPQGIETIFATNCVGHHILVVLLLPLLRSTITEHSASDVRIVVTSSSLHLLCQELNLDDLTSPEASKSEYYDGIWRYSRSKLGNILFTRELSRRLLLPTDEKETKGNPEAKAKTSEVDGRIFVNSFFPGNVSTEQMDIWKQYLGAPLGWAVKKSVSLVGQTTQDGAATAMFLAASPKVSEGEGIRGEYFIPVARRDDGGALGRDGKLGMELWEWTEKKVSETLGEGWQNM